ncbi:MAG: hypothetical protein JNL67_06115 [Planctomycetaceae bacterium]|nr:hypothetical protein [Planctomycetaceae bacterium]
MHRLILALVFLTLGSLGCQAFADGPVIATGAQRQQIRATPILERENRPFHFYGNTVRRLHARQTSGPGLAPTAQTGRPRP